MVKRWFIGQMPNNQLVLCCADKLNDKELEVIKPIRELLCKIYGKQKV